MEYVTATYTLLPDNTVEVKNRGMRGDEEHISIGHAKTTSEPGQLRVSFFWKFYSDYNIMAVGEKGEWMLIGSSSPKYLWILSRTPTLPQKQLEYIIALAAQRGYNVNKLIFVKQD
jgi:apolipoprotein D and lipocalin family protein